MSCQSAYTEFWTSMAKVLRIRNPLVRVALAECLGTCILIVFGDGSVAQSVLSNSTKGEFISINWSWCMAVMVGAYCSINVSGGHINPAVSLAMALLGRLPWAMLPVYMLAQYIGAFIGASIVYLVYFEAIYEFNNGMKDIPKPDQMKFTAGIFSTFPQDYLTAGEGFADQVVGTMMLVMALMAFTDKRNANVPKFLVPVLAGLTVFVIGSAYGFNCGYAINPARDLGPRIFTAVAGWGVEVFSFRNYNWFWVPIVGPHVGAILGALIYLLFIEFHWEDEKTEKESHVQEEDNCGMGEDNAALVQDE